MIKQELREAIKKSEFYVKSTFDHATDRYDAVENFITALLPIFAKYEPKVTRGFLIKIDSLLSYLWHRGGINSEIKSKEQNNYSEIIGLLRELTKSPS